VLILVLGAGLRMLWLRTPLVEYHHWRQVDTAAIARNLWESGFNVFYPEVDWGGRHGYVESEFPLVPAAAALVYSVFGQQDYFGRLVSVVFSTATIAATFALARLLLGSAAALAAAYLVAVSPSSVFFGRAFMPDAAMLFFWVFGVYAFLRYLRAAGGDPATRAPLHRWLWMGSASATLACVDKLPAVMMFAPIAAAAWQVRGREVLRDRALLFAVSMPLLLTLAWYVHAFMLYRQTGLTFGILMHPAKTYPLNISPGPWGRAWSKYSTMAVLTNGRFYMTILERLNGVLLLPWGLAGALAGAVRWKQGCGRVVADVWVLAMLLFIMVMGEVNFTHEYYQLPLVPAAALYFGAGVAPLFAGRWALATGRGLARAAVLVAVALVGFVFSGVQRTHYQRNAMDVESLAAGRAIERMIPADALTITVDRYGVTSPFLLYFSHRKGWSLGVEDLHPQVVEGLKRQGARYLATTVWPQIEHLRPDVSAYLSVSPRFVPPGAPEGVVVFDIAAAHP
jgi:4-amino-4-deoxy-L-arabinose transferase-like glycosyltransferase